MDVKKTSLTAVRIIILTILIQLVSFSCTGISDTHCTEEADTDRYSDLVQFLESHRNTSSDELIEAKDELYILVDSLIPSKDEDLTTRAILLERTERTPSSLTRLSIEDPEKFDLWVQRQFTPRFYAYYSTLLRCVSDGIYIPITSTEISSDTTLTEQEKVMLITIISGLTRKGSSPLALRVQTHGSSSGDSTCAEEYEVKKKRCDRDFVVHGAIGIAVGCLGGEVGVACAVASVWAEHILCYNNAQEDYARCVEEGNNN